ncbi:MAG: mechanosensitive ion channel [Acidobacteria bacterium]|nr:mechanosensitive ion channel [Acidobacteriota bacterium]
MIETIFEGELAETLQTLVRWLLGSGEVLLLGSALLLAAVAAAWLAGAAARGLLRRVALDNWAATAGLRGALSGFGIDLPLSRVLARVVFLLTLLFVGQIAADALGLAAVAAGLGNLLAYAPRVLAAGAILLGGVVAAGYARRAATRAAEDSGIDYASTLGSLAFIAVAFSVGLMAISQLRIATDAVWLTLGWMLGGLALAFGLSFGLGARDVTRNILAGFYARRIFRIGQEIEMQGQRGTLISITPTNTLIDQPDAVVSISNARLLDEVVRQPK